MQYLMGKPFNYCLLLSSIFLGSTLGIAQETTVKQVLEGEFTHFTADVLENIYVIEAEDSLFKYVSNPSKNIQQYYYSNASLGPIDGIDASNSLKLIISHSELSTLILLDVTLRQTERIYLPDVGIFSNPVAFCMAYDNSIWIFDDSEVSLVRVNYDGERNFQSQSLIQVLGFVPIVESMQFVGQYLVLHDEERGFIVCDQFGNFIRLIPELDVDHYQLTEKSLLVLSEQEIVQIPLKGVGRTKLGELPDGALSFYLKSNKLWYHTKEGIFLQELSTK